MTETIEAPQPPLAPGQRIRLCDTTLSAFYGTYGTVVAIQMCGHTYDQAHIIVQMDDVPPDEGNAIFYPRELVCVEAATITGA